MFLTRHKGLVLAWAAIAALGIALGIALVNPAFSTSNATLETTAYTSAFTLPTQAVTRPSLVGSAATAVVERTTLFTAGKYIGFALLFLGGVLALGFLLLAPFPEPLAGPEGDLLLLSLFSFFGRPYSLYPGILLRAGILFAALLSGRELVSWLKKRCPLSWAAGCRLGSLSSGKRGNAAAPLGLALGAVGLLVGSGTLWVLTQGRSSGLGYLAFCFLFCAVMEILCLFRFFRDADRLAGQIGNVFEGKPVSVSPGAFAQEEGKLLVLQKQHQEALEQAVTSERFRVDLIANVSHDLRTPLTAILGYGELLQRETLSPEGTQQLALLNQKAGYMRELVESLFELTRVSSGAAEPKMEAIDLIRLLEQTLGLFDDALTAAQLTVCRHYCGEKLPLVTDGSRMHQVFANLLGNAIKYALPGSRIHLQVKEAEDALTVRMTNVANYPMDFQPEEILQRFARGDQARSTPGSGLGLAIAQTYTASVGGSFQVAVDGDQFSAMVTLPKTERNL